MPPLGAASSAVPSCCRLGQLADARTNKADAQAAALAAAPVPVKGKELDLSFLEGSDALKFF